MENARQLNSLKTPLNDLLLSLGYSTKKGFHHYDLGTLFWSLTRLFEAYYRIITVVDLSEEKRMFLEADIENFIIRMRIVLNDTAFIIRQLLPENCQGLSNPKGGVHPKNREMSINDLFKFIEKQPNAFPEFTQVLTKNKEWIFKLRNERDNIIHYKSKVLVFGTEPKLSFAMLNAGGTEKTVATSDGGSSIVVTPIYEYVNSQMLSLYNLIYSDLVEAIRVHIKNQRIQFQELQMDSQMSCIGIELFKRINKIGM